jgi:hypothetical protein
MFLGMQHAWDYQKCFKSCLTKLKKRDIFEELEVSRKIILK